MTFQGGPTLHAAIESTSNPLKDAVQLYLRSVSTPGNDYELAQATARQYGYLLGKLMNHLGDDASLSSLTEDQVMGFVDSLVKDGYSPSSLVQARSCLRSFLAFLFQEGKVERDLTVGMRDRRRGRGKRRAKPLPVFLTTEEYTAFRSRLSSRDRLVADLLYCTGARIGELLAVTPRDVDPDGRMLTIRGKGGKMRRIFIVERLLPEPALPALRARMEGADASRPIFKVSPRRVQQAFCSARSESKLDKVVTPHKLRHSFATRLVGEGVRTEIVQQLLGHESISTTQIYAKVTQQAVLRELSDKKLL